jgi:hypothetical protein
MVSPSGALVCTRMFNVDRNSSCASSLLKSTISLKSAISSNYSIIFGTGRGTGRRCITRSAIISPIRRLRLLQFDIILPSSIVVLAGAVCGWWWLVILLVCVIGLLVVLCGTVARWCASHRPSGSSIWLIAHLTASTCRNAAVIYVSRGGTVLECSTYENRKKMRRAPKMIRPRTTHRAQASQAV